MAIKAITFLFIWNNGFVGEICANAQSHHGHLLTPAVLATNHLWLVPPRALRLSLGFEIRAQWQAPISGLLGTLYRLPVLRTDVGISSNVVLQIRGAAQQILEIDEAASQPMPGMPASGTTSDAGDFSIVTVLRLWENQKKNLALGLSVETRLPNSTQRKGIGTNTTDIFFAVLASKKWDAGMIFGDLGMGILSAPLETDVQNDVLLYGWGAAWHVRNDAQLFGEINGYVTTRNIIPAGTEARGTIRAGCAWQIGPWSVEACAQHGLTNNEGKWGGMISLARKVSW